MVFITLLLSLSIPACTHLAYQPSGKTFHDPATFGLRPEEVYFKSRDGTPLHGWFFPVAEGLEERGTVIQFHGNAENITSHFLSLVWITKKGYSLITFDYRGYGKSGGSPTQAGLNDDALAALEYAADLKKENITGSKGKKKLIAYGQSIGGAILLRALHDLKDKSSVDVVVIESSFSSYQEIVREKFSLSCITWPLQPVASLLISDEYAPEKVISTLSPTPLLVIHGDNDFIIPVHHGRRIYDLAGEPKWFWQVKGGKHINAMFHENGIYRTKLLEFFESLHEITGKATR